MTNLVLFILITLVLDHPLDSQNVPVNELLYLRFIRITIKRINKNNKPKGATKILTWNKNRSKINFN